MSPMYARGKITKVIIRQMEFEDTEKRRREMESVKLILENLIYKVLSRKLPKAG